MEKLANLERRPEEDTVERDLVRNRDTRGRRAILKEMLKQLPKTTLKDKKMESLQKKDETIQDMYLPSYPRGVGYMKKKRMRKDDDGDDNSDIDLF